jgi:hypothetical protein
MEDGERQAAEGPRKSKVTLMAKIDQRAIPALDRIANANGVDAAGLMRQFFDDISDVVQFLDDVQAVDLALVQDWFAKLIVQRCRGATPEALRAMGRIWDHAAELKAQQGGNKK